MVIGLFSDSYYPQINGVATSVHTLKHELERLGHTVYVFTTTDPEVNRRAELMQGVFRMRSVKVMSERRLGVGLTPVVQDWVQELGLDIVHTNSEFTLGILGRQVAHSLKIPFVHTYHTIWEEYTHFIIGKADFLDPAAKRLIRGASTAFCNAADRVIVPTEKVRSLLRAYGVMRPMQVIPTGIELEQFKPSPGYEAGRAAIRNKLGYTPTDRVLLSLGRVSEEKDIDVLLAGIAPWLERHPEGRFLCVGDGNARAGLEKQARQLGISQQCAFVGKQPWDEIAHWYHAADCFVSASLSETQGLTYIEALAAGLPVIARADAALAGVVSNGINGWQWENEVDLSTALEACWDSQAAYADLRRHALLSSESYSTKQFAAAVASLYEEALAQGPVRSAARVSVDLAQLRTNKDQYLLRSLRSKNLRRMTFVSADMARQQTADSLRSLYSQILKRYRPGSRAAAFERKSRVEGEQPPESSG